MRRYAVRVTGTVQGVGFRPFVHGLARELDLTGHVGNDVEGVFIEVQGANVDEFLRRLVADAPPLATIDAVESHTVEPQQQTGFGIVASADSAAGAVTSIPPDAAICSACLSEVRDPVDRRFGYPFIACTHCGPRFTMVKGLPYDRANTSMADFPLCDACRAEYTDPASRRYHAQPTACWDCGPRSEHARGRGRRVHPGGPDRGDQGHRRVPPGLRRDRRCRAVQRLRDASSAATSPSRSWSPTSHADEQIAELDEASRELLRQSRPARRRCLVARRTPASGVSRPATTSSG